MMESNHKFNWTMSQVPLLILRRFSATLITTFLLLLGMKIFEVEPSEPYQALIIIIALLSLMILPGGNRSDMGIPRPVWSLSFSVAVRWTLLCGILLLLGYTTKTSSTFSRKLLFSWIIASPPMIVLAQYFLDIGISRLFNSADNVRNVVIAGANVIGHGLARKIESSSQLGMVVKGFFDDRSSERLSNEKSAPILGKLADIPSYLKMNGTDILFMALPIRNIKRVSELLDELQDTTASIYFVPDVFVFDLIQCRSSEIGGMPIIALCETPFQGTQAFVKNISDYVIAALVLLLTSPLMILIALAIKLTSPGRIIFKQRRYGLDGREIVVYKFRTMSVEQDSEKIRQATKNDPRVTPLGAFLRRYSLDELPQFINVLQGRMSVVGPRPHAVAHNEEYRPLIKGYMIRHKVNPGITGLAQVHGCRGETNSVEDMRRRIDYDLTYLREWSLRLDVEIIFKTIGRVFHDDMAY